MKKFLQLLTAAIYTNLLLCTTIFATNMPKIDISADSAVLINADTGTVLFQQNASKKRAMASTTKIMTALLTLEAGDLESPFTVDSYAIKVEGTSMGLQEGDIVTRRALAIGMLLPSGNDAANAAAINISGSFEEFCKKMNKRAGEIGMENTNFVTPSGLDAKNHYSTAYDMAMLAKTAMQNADFRAICGNVFQKATFGNPPYERTLYNSNKLLKKYEGCIGIKTGFTDNARRCLVSEVSKGGVNLIAVTLNAPDDWNDHTKMYNYGFTVVESKAVNCNVSDIEIPVVGGITDTLNPILQSPVILALTEEERKHIAVIPLVKPFLYADVKMGEVVGSVIITLNGSELYRTNLIAPKNIPRADAKLNIFEKIFQLIARG